MKCVVCSKKIGANNSDYSTCINCNITMHHSCFLKWKIKNNSRDNRCVNCNLSDKIVIPAIKEIAKYSAVYNFISPPLSI
jgi:hypothetical protein